jgi:hypothetical protein
VRHRRGFNAATTLVCSKNSVQLHHQLFSSSRCPALFEVRTEQQLINPRPMSTGARGTNTIYSHQRRGRIPRSSPRGLVPLCRGRAPVQRAASTSPHRPGLRCSRQAPPRKHNAASAAAAPKATGYSTTHQAPRTRTRTRTPDTTHRSAARLPKSGPRWPRRVARAADCSAVRSTYLLRALAPSRSPRTA